MEPIQPEQSTPEEQPMQPMGAPQEASAPEQPPVMPAAPAVDSFTEPAEPALEPTAPVAPVTPVAAVNPVSPAAVPTQGVKKGLAITALVLSIVSVLLGILWFVAAPLAITAIILAIVSLRKHRGGKGMSIAGLIIGGISLVVLLPLWLIINLIAYQAIQEKAGTTSTGSSYSFSIGNN